MALGDLGTAFVKISPNLTDFASGLRDGLGAILPTALGRVGDAFEDLGASLNRKFTLPMGIAVGANITQWQSLDKSIRETLTLLGSGGTSVIGAQFDEMREGISDVAREIGVVESEISGGLYQALSAGVPRGNVFEFLETAQKAAIAGATDTFTAVDALTTAVNAFPEIDSATQAADILFRTVARGKTTLDELAASMARAAPIAAAAGVPFDEFNAVVATMTLSGTQTAEAFTNIKAALTGLLRPSEDMLGLWSELGFASGDVAVETLGLQGAMQAVFDAADGSVGQISKWLGGMEAANAVLQVTGDNSERFVSVLGDTTDALGATDQAFRTMQDGTGRAFGALTASFDRLGNAGGDLADDFVVPIVRAVTGVVDELAEITKGVIDFVEPVADAWGSMLSSIGNNEVFQKTAAAVGAFAITLGGLASALGITLLIGGKVIGLITGFTSIKLAVGAVVKLGSAFGSLSGNLLKFAGTLTSKVLPGSKLLKKGLEAAAGASKALGTRLLASVGTFVGIGVAIAAVAAGLLYLKQRHDDLIASQQLTTDLADKMAESLGLVVQSLGEIPEEIQTELSFRVKNAEILKGIQGVLLGPGGLADAQGKLYNISFRYIQQGNTPEEALEAAQRLADIQNIEINFDVEDLGDTQRFLDNVAVSAAAIGESYEGGLINASTQGKIADIGKSLLAAFYVDPRSVLDNLDAINTVLGPELSTTFNKAFLEALALDSEADIPFPELDYIDADQVRKSLDEAFGLAFSNFLWADYIDPRHGRGGRLQAPEIDIPEPPEFDPYAGRDRVFEPFTEEQAATYKGLVADLEGAFADASAVIVEKQEEIRQSFLDQMPVLDIYGGALEQSFSKWRASQDKFQADFQNWTDRSEEILGGLPHEVRKRIEAEPLSVKTWLASLSPKNLETALAELTETFTIVSGAAEDELSGRMPQIMEDAFADVQRVYDAKAADAADAGYNVAHAFSLKFKTESALWADIAGRNASNMITRVNRIFEITSPSKVMQKIAHNIADSFSSTLGRREDAFDIPITVPEGGGGAAGGTNVEVNLYNTTTSNLRSDLQRSLSTARVTGAL